MPRTGIKSSARLDIELIDPQPTYSPGDILQGYVVSEEAPEQQSPYFAARLKLFGRAKTKYVVKTTNGTSIERGRAVFFEEILLLHKGSGRCTEGGHHAWRFSITIPETSQPGFALRNDCDQFRADPPYLHTRDAEKKEIDVTRHPLPSIMYYKSDSTMSGKMVEAYIEYVLLAEGAGTTASYPLYVRQRSIPSPVQNFKMQTRTFEKVIKTPKLLPEHATADLSFKQKSKKFFRPSKTLRYGYTVKVEYPTVIQLEHPQPIPLKIYLIPDLDPKKTTICASGDISELPAVQVLNMEFKLKGDVNIRCPGMMWDTTTEKNHNFEFSFRGSPSPIEIPVITPPTTELYHAETTPDIPSKEEKSVLLAAVKSTPAMNVYQSINGTEVTQTPTGWRPLYQTTPIGSPFAFDLGSHASILLGTSASSTLSNPPVSFKRQVYPTFATYNIYIKYRLCWKLYLVCAGETHDIRGEAPVTVLAPSEEQEAIKTRELGTQGMKKNYDDLEAGAGQVIQIIGQVLQAVV